jgi:hypothetical protein
MIRCSCGNRFPFSTETYVHTQVFEGFAVIFNFDCPECKSTMGVALYESVDEFESEPIAAE